MRGRGGAAGWGGAESGAKIWRTVGRGDGGQWGGLSRLLGPHVCRLTRKCRRA